MKIYDISQEVFGCQVYPGDPTPKRHLISSIESGGVCNLTAFEMCAHNGTHMDAPLHFIKNGKAVGQIGLEATVGMAFVAAHHGTLTEKDAARILEKAKEASAEAAKRILLKGDLVVSLEAARAFASEGVLLLGNESQSVGPMAAPMEVHLVLLGAEVVLLEGIRLDAIKEGVYLLNAAPLHLGGAEGAPCRAVLIDLEG